MADTTDFLQFVDEVCKRPQMFSKGRSFAGVIGWIEGYALGSASSLICDDARHVFNYYVTSKLKYPQKWIWSSAIEDLADSDKDAILMARDLIFEFALLCESKTLNEVHHYAEGLRRSHVEGMPEKAWRAFSKAIHRCRRDEIEPLIQQHPHASILWDSPPPPADVIAMLDGIAEDSIVSVVAGSEADGEVEIITPDFGRVNVKYIDQTWRVDASKVITIRQRNE